MGAGAAGSAAGRPAGGACWMSTAAEVAAAAAAAAAAVAVAVVVVAVPAVAAAVAVSAVTVGEVWTASAAASSEKRSRRCCCWWCCPCGSESAVDGGEPVEALVGRTAKPASRRYRPAPRYPRCQANCQ